MSLLVTGSIATDHLMSFGGKFSDSLVVDQLDKISLSFLVEDLDVRRGGCAANISFGLGCLGLRPILVGAVGEDFVDYRSWLERHNVDCESVHVSDSKHTARFVCTNDASMAQIASFYPGAMSEAREIELKPVADRIGGVDYVLVGPNDPEAMLRHTDECRDRGYPFIADPSQQLAFGDGDMIRELIDGAAILFSNEYESALIEQKTGWSADEVLSRVGTWVVTLGAAGVRVERKGEDPIVVAAVPEIAKVEPTGVGDAFRAGFMAALAWGLSLERAAQLGCLLAVYVVEKVGTQEYSLHQAAFVKRFADTYGEAAAAEVAAHVRTPRP
ncbi:carbohydrate kinase family protein [Nocardioides sp. WL0053]|uniref:Carbohydrate kinase family protein n=1 Tax=Nocardioides jiangsuensis TaxID=2866161 RepID=A0ABS7RFK7_9ACTN|nr:carbohydrate kinase family protein [Nocardioides jiangsuensis]MBY9073815.1 carbohydrate kinase family protein [Nocardioides jiangsuensis]